MTERPPGSTAATAIAATVLVPGHASGPLLHAGIGLSFWGGIDAESGTVIDHHHPLAGKSVTGTVLAIPSGRGSCTASGVLIELLRTGRAPAAIVLCEDEHILPLGAMMAGDVFGRSLPILRIAPADFAALARWRHATVAGGSLVAGLEPMPPIEPPGEAAAAPDFHTDLSPRDRAMLDGDEGAARQAAMRIILRMADLAGAPRLVDVKQAHLDCCIYTGPSSVMLAEHFQNLGGRFAVPTTLNAISTDLRPGARGIAGKALSAASARQAAAYLAMGAAPSFTCAPYLLPSCPAAGEHLGWAESNAVMFANSVLGARTEKYPDYLDLCVALTGRAPLAGCQTDAGRAARVLVTVDAPPAVDDSFWPLLGYLAGKHAPNRIPVITGVAHLSPARDDLKAFSAAFATTSAAPMAHISGVTPEAPDVTTALQGQAPEASTRIGRAELAAAWGELDSGVAEIGLVAIGNPHASAEEIIRLAAALAGRAVRAGIGLVITTSRAELARAEAAGARASLEDAGARFVCDTCWCMIGAPLLPPAAGAVMTNSGKFAHYGPGLTGAGFRFGSLADCAAAACDGRLPKALPAWLSPAGRA